MSAQENKTLSNRVAQAISEGDLEALDELMAPELAEEFKRDVAEIRRAFPDIVGLEAAKGFAMGYRQAFPDLKTTTEDLIAEGDKVVARWRSRATHQGEYMGIPPTGKEVEFTGISFYRIEGGKIAQSWNIEDKLGLMRQIGAYPEPEQSEEASPT